MGEKPFVMRIIDRSKDPALSGPFEWEPTLEDRRQAEANHYQTLERLNERGGLSWGEVAFVLLHRRYDRGSRVHQDRAYAKAVCYDLLKVRAKAGRKALDTDK